MSASLTLAAFNFRPPPPLSIASPSSAPSLLSPSSAPSLRSGRRTIRSEMKVYRGTHMREQWLTEMIEQKVAEAKQVCGEDERSDECRVAWDEVEEVSQAKADLRVKIHQFRQDPLQHFCLENPETDECRVYED